MAATIYEVAALAGVSPATVSRVLNGTPVSAGYAEKVQEAAAALDFRPNRTARTLRRKTSEIIALIIPDIENPFFTSLARGVEDTALAAGYSLVLCNTDEQPDKEVRYLDVALSEHVAGVILAPVSATTDLRPLLAAGTPVVAVDRSARGYDIDAVVMDDQDAARRVTTMLYDQGFTTVGCITGPRGVETADARAAGWREVFTSHGRARPERYLVHADFRLGGGRAAMTQLMSMSCPPDAVFVANNLMSVGALEYLMEIGNAPPQTGLATIGELPVLGAAVHDVTVLAWKGRPLGVIAAEVLLARIGGDDQPARRIITQSLDDQPGTRSLP